MPPYTHQTSHEYLLNACKENNLEQINARTSITRSSKV